MKEIWGFNGMQNQNLSLCFKTFSMIYAFWQLVKSYMTFSFQLAMQFANHTAHMQGLSYVDYRRITFSKAQHLGVCEKQYKDIYCTYHTDDNYLIIIRRRRRKMK